MATLQELKSMINKNKTAMLFLTKDHPDNDKKQDIIIRVMLSVTGHYIRSFRYVEPLNSPTDRSIPYSRWSHLIEDMPTALSESNQWEIDPKAL